MLKTVQDTHALLWLTNRKSYVIYQTVIAYTPTVIFKGHFGYFEKYSIYHLQSKLQQKKMVRELLYLL